MARITKAGTGGAVHIATGGGSFMKQSQRFVHGR